jgi:hypothetical protein
MSVPFNLEVALAAIELMTDPTRDRFDTKSIYEELVARIKTQHPMLISEHVDYVGDVIKYAIKLSTQANAGQMTEQQALQKLRSGYKEFPIEALQRTLTYCKQHL